MAHHGVDGLLAGLEICGAAPELRHGLVTFKVVPVSGDLAGRVVDSGISVQEAASWPLIPPHWVHLPSDVRLQHTNAQQSTHPGWLMHSRNIVGWGDALRPGQAWLAHLRAVLAGAVR